MKTNKVFLGIVAVAMIILASCSPAQIASGKYSGNYSATGVPSTSGTATVTVTENGADAVDIVASSSGNPDFIATNVSVVRYAIPGITVVNLDAGGNIDVNGTVAEAAGIKEISLTMDNNIDTTYISFTGTKM